MKNPAIASLDTGSLCHGIYSELYNQFFGAQDRKDAEHPYGVEEGDEVSLRLHNAAYGFAYAIAGAVDGSGGNGSKGGGILLDYLRKNGGNMSGRLGADYGFEAGQGNKTLLQTYSNADGAGIRINEDIDVWGGIHMAGRKVIGYHPERGTLEISVPIVDFAATEIHSAGRIVVGDGGTGVSITPSGLTIAGHGVWHNGNANLQSVDWTMKDASVVGALSVAGDATLSGSLKALHGAMLGTGGRTMMQFRTDGTSLGCDLSFAEGFGIRIGGATVLGRTGVSDITIGGTGGDLLLGNADTPRVKLIRDLTDADGDYTMLSPYGAAHFPDSLTVRHNYGDVLLSSYRSDADNEGIVIHKLLRFGSETGPYLRAENSGLSLHSTFEYNDRGKKYNISLYSTLRHALSTSLLDPRDRTSSSLVIETQADSVHFAAPVEAKERLGIAGSLTRLASGCLFFTDEIRLVHSADGITHHGNARMTGDISSERFSSGFAGSGWAIQRSPATGNATATFDELTVRKRMRIYELDIQRTSVTDGALWISNSCRGDTVERIR